MRQAQGSLRSPDSGRGHKEAENLGQMTLQHACELHEVGGSRQVRCVRALVALPRLTCCVSIPWLCFIPAMNRGTHYLGWCVNAVAAGMYETRAMRSTADAILSRPYGRILRDTRCAGVAQSSSHQGATRSRLTAASTTREAS